MALTKKGALLITNDIDRIATVIGQNHTALGIPQKVADGFAQWCDRVSDRIETTAGIDPKNKAAELKLALSGQQDHKTDYPFDEGKTHDGEEIGQEKSGPAEGDGDEPYMKGEFTQQENRELREKQQAGQVPAVNTDPRGPRPGVQASLDTLTAAVTSGKFSEAASAKLAEALNLAAEIAKSAADEDEDDDEKGKEASYDHGYNLNA
tara:strand:+ start:6889 stop:7509 length:621 start_codon:yes stop_codon:yes gene_type:complete